MGRLQKSCIGDERVDPASISMMQAMVIIALEDYLETKTLHVLN